MLIYYFFCMDIFMTGRQHMWLLLFVRWEQVCLLSHQIAGFFNYHHIWKESVNTFVSPLSFCFSFSIYFLSSFINFCWISFNFDFFFGFSFANKGLKIYRIDGFPWFLVFHLWMIIRKQKFFNIMTRFFNLFAVTVTS